VLGDSIPRFVCLKISECWEVEVEVTSQPQELRDNLNEN
jgi:hypothetical protein